MRMRGVQSSRRLDRYLGLGRGSRFGEWLDPHWLNIGPSLSIFTRFLADVSELFRPFDKSPLAKLAFFLGCWRITDTVYLLGGHFGCFRGSVRSRLPSMSRFKLQLDKPKDGFGQCRFVALFSCPGVHHFHAVRTKDGWSLRHHARWCDGLSLYARPYASFSFHLHHLPTQRRSQSPRRKAAVIPALPGAYALWAVRARCAGRDCVTLDGSESVWF